MRLSYAALLLCGVGVVALLDVEILHVERIVFNELAA